jgi:hypothetical protein
MIRKNPYNFLSTDMAAKLIIEPKKTKDGTVEFTLIYKDPKTDNSFTITVTSEIDELLDHLKSTLEGEVQAMTQQK